MSSYTKIYTTILDSSIWSACDTTRLVWITMLAMATRNGIVHASREGLRRRANVSAEAVDRALNEFMSPDPDDKSGVQNGVRIIEMQGCWQIINFHFYSECKSLDAVRKAQWRAKKAASGNVLDNDPSSIPIPSTSSNTPKPPRGRRKATTDMPEGFAPSDKHAEKAKREGLNVQEQFQAFCTNVEKRGARYVSWDAAFSEWLGRQKQFAKPGASSPVAQPVDRDAIARKNSKIMGNFK